MREDFPLAAELDRKIRSLDGVERRKSRWASQDAYVVGRREFVHFHKGDEVDIRLTREVQRREGDALRGDGRVGFRRGPSEWVTFTLRAAEDVEAALRLIRVARDANR